MDKKQEKVIHKTIDALLKHLGISGDFSYEIQDDVIQVVLETEDSGMVIGYHGEVLEALQLILSLAISKKLGNFIRVSVEVGDYKKNRTEWLQNLAQQAKDRALAEQGEVALTNLKSWERRVIHLILQEDKEVVSESAGEGRDRKLVIKPRV